MRWTMERRVRSGSVVRLVFDCITRRTIGEDASGARDLIDNRRLKSAYLFVRILRHFVLNVVDFGWLGSRPVAGEYLSVN